MSRNSLFEAGTISEDLVTAAGLESLVNWFIVRLQTKWL